MKNIITAINDPQLNEELKKQEEINVIGKDIQYREAIFEILEKNKNIDCIILNEEIPGQINIEELINKIKKINNKINIIIILLEENLEKENMLKNKCVKNIYYNKLNVNNLIYLINNNELKKENKTKNKTKNNKNYNADVVTVSGFRKTGKSTLSVLLSLYLFKKNKKIILIDFNIFKLNLFLFFNVKKYSKKLIKEKNNKLIKVNLINYKEIIKNIKKFEIKINNNINLISGLDIIFKNLKNNDEKIIEILINNIINYYKERADYIIIDLGYKNNNVINRTIVQNSDKNIIAMEPNLLGVKELEGLIAKYVDDYKIAKNSLHIVINRYDFNSINYKILKNIIGKECKIYKINFNKEIKNIKTKNNYKNNKKIINKKLKNIFNKIIK